MVFGLFNYESDDWTEASAVESDFYSREDAEQAIASRYSNEDQLIVHEIEQPEEADACETCGNEVCDCDDENNEDEL